MHIVRINIRFICVYMQFKPDKADRYRLLHRNTDFAGKSYHKPRWISTQETLYAHKFLPHNIPPKRTCDFAQKSNNFALKLDHYVVFRYIEIKQYHCIQMLYPLFSNLQHTNSKRKNRRCVQCKNRQSIYFYCV